MKQCIFDLGIIDYNPCHYMDSTCCIFFFLVGAGWYSIQYWQEK